MSIMRTELDKWRKLPDISVMHQTQLRETGTICSYLPEETVDKMEQLAEESQHHKITEKIPILDAKGNTTGYKDVLVDIEQVEIGTPINKDLTLGFTSYGNKQRVGILRDDNTIGTYHAHIKGDANPSLHDILDMITRNDAITCIGVNNPITHNKIKCFQQHEPQWTKVRNDLIKWQDELDEFNRRALQELGANKAMFGLGLSGTTVTKTGRPRRITLENLLKQLTRRKQIDFTKPPGDIKTIGELEAEINEIRRNIEIATDGISSTEIDLINANNRYEDAKLQYETAIKTVSSGTTIDPEKAISDAKDELSIAQTEYINAVKALEPYNLTEDELPYYPEGKTITKQALNRVGKTHNAVIRASDKLRSVWSNYIGSKPNDMDIISAEQQLDITSKQLSEANNKFNLAVSSNNTKRIADAIKGLDEVQASFFEAQDKYYRLIEPGFIDEVRSMRLNLEDANRQVIEFNGRLSTDHRLLNETQNKLVEVVKELEFAKLTPTQLTEQEELIKSLSYELAGFENKQRELVSTISGQIKQLREPPNKRYGQLIVDDCHLVWQGIFSKEYYGTQNLLLEEL